MNMKIEMLMVAGAMLSVGVVFGGEQLLNIPPCAKGKSRFVVLAVGVNVIAKSVLPNRKELLILAGVISFVGSVGCLFAGAIGFYLRASRKLCATLVFVGSVWCALSLAALVPELRHRSSLPSQGRILTPAELDALSG